MKTRLWMSALVGGALALPALATVISGAQVSAPIAGSIITAYAETAMAGTPVLLYKAPWKAVGQFTLTQVCLQPNDRVSLKGSSMGSILTRSADAGSPYNAQNNGDCLTFSPGLAIPYGEELSCVHELSSGPSKCIITGVKSAPVP